MNSDAKVSDFQKKNEYLIGFYPFLPLKRSGFPRRSQNLDSACLGYEKSC
jgi:hypothetical protein